MSEYVYGKARFVRLRDDGRLVEMNIFDRLSAWLMDRLNRRAVFTVVAVDTEKGIVTLERRR